MKKFLCIVLCAVLVFSLSSCKKSNSSNELYMESYNDGYFEGRDGGQKQIAYYVEEKYSNIYSQEVDDALRTLAIYADGIYESEFGEQMSEAELQRLIQILLQYQIDVEKLIYEIDDIEIY